MRTHFFLTCAATDHRLAGNVIVTKNWIISAVVEVKVDGIFNLDFRCLICDTSIITKGDVAITSGDRGRTKGLFRFWILVDFRSKTGARMSWLPSGFRTLAGVGLRSGIGTDSRF